MKREEEKGEGRWGRRYRTEEGREGDGGKAEGKGEIGRWEEEK